MRGEPMAWVAAAMAVAGLGWWIRRMVQVQVPRNRIVFLGWMLVAGVLGAVAIASGSGWLVWGPGGFAVFLALFVAATISISRQRVDGAVAVGDAMPAFQALDDRGERFDSASLAGRPVLLKFFRGHW